jgi:FAD/FMN-containing dehydrogenase
MSKAAAYLQEHIKGKVSTNPAVLQAASTDESILRIVPEMVIYPKVTNDIRKVARFAWQLAEKGHVMPLTARGYGGDLTGAAIGKGAVIILPAHMNRIFELDTKRKMVRIQAGASVHALREALLLHGLAVPAFIDSAVDSTVGGAVANNMRGPLSGRYGDTNEWVDQLEVVLATGEVLQTGRLSKRELGKKKGLQTFEGEIYRAIDSLIEENKQLIEERIASDLPNNTGFASIARVKRRDGSFDLTPLIAGSQGTLGIISELILRAEFVSKHRAVAAMTFKTVDAARDAIDVLSSMQPAHLEYFDNALFTIAAAQGKTYDFRKNASGPVRSVVLVGFDDFNERSNMKKLKKAAKLLSKNDDVSIEIADGDDAADLLAIRDVSSYLLSPSEKDLSAPALFDGVSIPREQFINFAQQVAALATKYEVALPLYSRELDGIVSTRPLLRLNRVGDKQKMFKLLDEYSVVVSKVGGYFIGQDGEGRVKSRHARAFYDDDVKALFDAVKKAFDPYGIFNPGVKQDIDVREVVTSVRSDLGAVSDASRSASAYWA